VKRTLLMLGLLSIPVCVSAQPLLQRDLISAAGIACASGTTRLAGSVGGYAFGTTAGPAIRVLEGFWFPEPGGASGIAAGPAVRYPFHLYPASPNPTRSLTMIGYSVPGVGDALVPIRLEIFDVQGRRVVTLADRTLRPGRHAEPWLARDAASQPVAPGVYFCRLQAGRASATRALVVLN